MDIKKENKEEYLKKLQIDIETLNYRIKDIDANIDFINRVIDKINNELKLQNKNILYFVKEKDDALNKLIIKNKELETINMGNMYNSDENSEENQNEDGIIA